MESKIFHLSQIYVRGKIYLHNSLWIVLDKVASLVVGFITSIILARYLGPTDFGTYSYAISLSMIFAATGQLGLGGLIVREIINNPNERGVTLGTAFVLKFMGMAFGYCMLIFYGSVFEGISTLDFKVIAIAGSALLFKPFDILDCWFQALLKARYVAYSLLIALFVVSVSRLVLVFYDFSLLYFVAANIAQAMVIAIVLALIYHAKSTLRYVDWAFDWHKAKELLSQGWLVYLGSIFAFVYLKVDQIMLRWLEGPEAVGVYAIAAQLSEAWYFIPTAIVASLFPRLIALRKEDSILFNTRLQQLFDFLAFLALTASLLVSIISQDLIELLFGEDYAESSRVLVIHIWSSVFIFMRAAFSRWILIENALVFSLVTHGLGAVANILLNFFLIPRFGVVGAASATLISYAISSFFSLALYRATRPIFFMMLISIFSPARYAYALAINKRFLL